MATSPHHENPFWKRASAISSKARSVREIEIPSSDEDSAYDERPVSVGSYVPVIELHSHSTPHSLIPQRQPTMIETTDKSGYVCHLILFLTHQFYFVKTGLVFQIMLF